MSEGTRDDISKELTRSGEWLTAEQLAERIGKTASHVRTNLNAMKAVGRVARIRPNGSPTNLWYSTRS
jgi:predicted ArsR family transcriptional regulator